MELNLENLKNRSIGIFGNGISGVAVKKLIEHLGGEAVIYDEKRILESLTLFNEEKALSHDLIINSPGFPPSHPWFAIAERVGCEIMGEVDFANQFWNGRTIFVTGTNGKSTITHLLTAAFLKAGYEAYAFGNIGIPFSDHHRFNAAEGAIAVVELSSFQAWNLKLTNADGLIWSNFAEDHLDWHGEILHYFDSKWNAVQSVLDAPIVIGAGVMDCALDFGKEIPAHTVVVDDQLDSIFNDVSISAINQLNVEYVKRFVAHYHIDESVVDEVVENFAFLPHRLEHVGTYAGVSYWNDSKATNFHAVDAALGAFYEPVLWLGGGLSKGGDISAFAKKIAPKVKKAITFGAVSQELADALLNEGVLTFAVTDLEEAMGLIRFEAAPGDEVLLSPGFASFDQFTGYADRGQKFRDLVDSNFNTHTEINPIHVNN